LLHTIPVIYTSDSYWPIARIAKIKLNENSKIPAFWNYLPEMNHNELVGFTNTHDNYRVVMLRDPDEDPRISRRMEVATDVLRSQGIGLKATIWDMEGDTRLLKIFSTLMIMDWASYYLALQLGIDPTPVKMVEDFKALMK
jgi:glucose/mannose-6-phosphate isomerase